MASNAVTKPPKNQRGAGGRGITGAAGKRGKDRLSLDEVEARYGYTAAQMAVDPEIQRLFQQAWSNDWKQPEFQKRFETSDWWAANSDSMRKYLLRSANPDQDWLDLQADTFQAIRKEANAIGVNLSDEQIRRTAEKSLMKGWYLDENKYELRRELTSLQPEGQYGGDIRANAESLKNLAFQLGVTYDDKWFESAGKSIATELTDSNYWENNIKDQASKLFPALSDQIKAGQTVRNIASPYLAMMRDEWDMNPEAIQINDPTVLRGLTGGSGDGGRTGPMDLGSFQQMLRKDPRWLNTAKAQNNITGVASSIMQMFGLRG